MYPRQKQLKFFTVTFLLFLSFPLQADSFKISALKIFEITLAQAAKTTVEERVTEAVYLNQQGYDLYQKGQAEEALKTLNRALTIFREFKARGGEGNSLNYIGEVYLAQGKYDKAMGYFQQALVIFTELGKLPDGDRSYEGYTLQYIGETYDKKGQYEQALKTYQQALDTFRKLSNSSKNNYESLRTSEYLTLNAIGAVYFRLGEYRKALTFYQESLAIHREQRSYIGEAQTLNNMGVIYANLSQYAQALDYYQQALAIIRQRTVYRGDEAAILNNIAALYFSLGEYPKALNFSQQASEIYKKLSSQELPGVNTKAMDLLYDVLGKSSLNPTFLSKGLAVRAGVGNILNPEGIVRAGEALNLNNIGQIYRNQGQDEKALTLYQQALAIYKEIGNRLGQGITLNNIGQVYDNLRQYEQALNFHQQALAIYKEEGDKAGIGVALSNIGQVYEQQNKLSQALNLYQQALAIHREIGDKSGEGIALRNIGYILLKTGKITEAITTLQEAIKVMESLRPGLSDANKVSIFEAQSLSYRFLQKALISQNKINEALETSERGRARAFVELLAKRISNQETENPASQSVNIQPPTISQIKQIASNQKATLVQYSLISEQELYIWVIKPTGEINFRQVNLTSGSPNITEVPKLSPSPNNESSQSSASQATKLANKVQETRNSLFSLSQTNAKTNLKQLHQLLIQPIADLLPTQPDSRVIFIPQKELFLVPFPALIDTKNSYLIENYTILTAPSIQVLDLTNQKRQKNQQNSSQTALVIGNPQMPSLSFKIGEPPEQLSQLPGSEAEAKAIGTLLNVQPIIGNQATKDAFKQKISTAKIIHLATHGLLNDIEGMGFPGAIALSPSGTDKGLLTSTEIFDLKLNAELVVLSACDTGRGRITGDGVIGLSRAFISAGTPSLIVSLWPIPDDSTAFLMPEFYRQLKQQTDKSKALRSAMLVTMKKYPEPKNWAAFTLIGEAD
jgi:CHAT domain-containing protein/tetratricopeptide (TPR) repeat protein